jgi:hypothetical protein
MYICCESSTIEILKENRWRFEQKKNRIIESWLKNYKSDSSIKEQIRLRITDNVFQQFVKIS